MKVFYNGHLYEMAKPLSHHLEYKLYHGTDENHAKDILNSGYLIGRIEQGKAQQSPVKGRIYVTKDIVYAAGYAGAYTQWGQGSRSDRINGTTSFTAYVFVIDSNSIEDILIDEDILGEIGTYKRLADNKYPSQIVEYLRRIAKEVATPNQYIKASEGEMAYQSAIGKKMQKVIPEVRMQELIDVLPHLATKSPIENKVPIIGYYTINKPITTEEEFLANATYHEVI